MSSGGRRGDDWLSERQTEGVELAFRVRRWLVREDTAYQHLELAETHDHGLVLALDGKIMLSERDEPFYHEMLAHPALLAHESPRSVLVIGGGDGGTLREVLQHPSVKEAHLVEIDGRVVEVARCYLERVHRGAFADPRVSLHLEPGEDFIREKRALFDVILVDSTDPVGPGKALFSASFLADCRKALRDGGVLALQAGTPFYWPEELEGVLRILGNLFPHVRVYLGFVPVYPAGMWAYVLAGLRDLERELECFSERFAARGLETVYFTPELGRAAAVLPRFVRDIVRAALEGA